MTSNELIRYFDDKFQSQNEIHDAKLTRVVAEVKAVNDRLDVIIKQNDIRNHRIEKSEEDIKKLKDQVNSGALKCEFIQDGKNKKIINNRWFFGAMMAILTSLIMLSTRLKTKEDKIPVEFFYRASDSTVYIPPIYSRAGSTLREVSVEYYDIEHGEIRGKSNEYY